MKLYLVLPIIIVAVMAGCSPEPASIETPVTDTMLPPTFTPIAPQSLATPMPSATPTAIPAPTEIVPGAVLFEDDFENYRAEKFVYISGDWEVVTEEDGNKVFEIKLNTEEAIQKDEGAGFGFGLKSWTNYSAEYRFKMRNSKANVWMKFRSTIGDNEAYYVVWVSAEYSTVNLHIKHDLDHWVTLESLDNAIWDERWYKVKIEAQGSRLRVYLNDNLMLQTDDTRITSGGLEIGTMTGTDIVIDDIRVVALDAVP